MRDPYMTLSFLLALMQLQFSPLSNGNKNIKYVKKMM